MKKSKEKNKIGLLSFLPLFVFLFLYVGMGLYFTLQGNSDPFNMFPRHVALFVALFVALIINRKETVDKKIDVFCESAGNKNVMLIVFIYLLAAAFQGAAASIGGKDSIINLALTYIPGSMLVPGIFIMCAIISTSIGTSMGTMAACAPIGIALATKSDLNIALVCAAMIGGSYFGDNLSFISDTTISAARGCGTKMKDKFKTNVKLALPSAIISTILFYIFSSTTIVDPIIGNYQIITIIPYLVVLYFAIKGINVVSVLFIGILTSMLVGIINNTFDFYPFIQSISNSMSGMFSISVVAIILSGISGLIKHSGGIEYLVDKTTKYIHNKKSAQIVISLLSGILSALLVNNTIAIIISSPIAKELANKYNIAKEKVASLIDIFACSFLSITPHDGGMLIMTSLALVSPLEIIKYSFYTYVLLLVTTLSILFDKTNK